MSNVATGALGTMYVRFDREAAERDELSFPPFPFGSASSDACKASTVDSPARALPVAKRKTHSGQPAPTPKRSSTDDARKQPTRIDLSAVIGQRRQPDRTDELNHVSGAAVQIAADKRPTAARTDATQNDGYFTARLFGNALHFLPYLVALLGVTGFMTLLWVMGTAGGSMYQFFFGSKNVERAMVQGVTLYGFVLGLSLLVQRLLTNVQSVEVLVRQRMESVRNRLIRCKPMAVKEYVRNLAESDADELETGYTLVGDIVHILPLLGLFGTVLGLGQGLYMDFVAGTAKSMADATHFAMAIGTAFDTTRLAIGCLIILYAAQALLRKHEERLRKDVHIRLETEVEAALVAQPPEGIAARTEEGDENFFQRISLVVTDQVKRSVETVCAATTQALDARAARAGKHLSDMEQTAHMIGMRFEEHLKATSDDAAAAVGREIAVAGADAVRAVTAEIAKAAAVMLRETVEQQKIGWSRIVAAISEQHSTAACQELIRASTSTFREQTESVRDIREMVHKISQRNGHDAALVTAAIQDNASLLCRHLEDVLKQPRPIRIIEQPLGDVGRDN